MFSRGPMGSAFNLTRQSYLATRLAIAESHWSRFRGLMGTDLERFPAGQGLWIIPSRGVHTFGMRFAIDVAYLNDQKLVIHLEHGLKPWRVAPVRLNAKSILELPANTLAPTGTLLGDQIRIIRETEEQVEANPA